ncbi:MULTISPECIES: hypothetical protein [Cryobacterium]|uniref:Uncharacterized protein n=1 Tax=Cryobacterium zongtaii TaxID=1259217 RepID=A0A2S3ZJ44_9MICO|nr:MULTISPECIES: hypothetical protein [Cryobacterium]ASD22378.1 hypothetical protein B7495_10010 [Cryobacterium sp. LW097]POH65679.1 hypothetical protein C3B60_12465 [Cryobacterium zongtaii]POH67594.1 hypothetical protein C3B61_06775 [Cryobacterium zongtaii]TFC45379.1 hypothetical protein E3O57_09800 [Cryobacterium sp. TMN-39-2]TFC55888.1 hypothetical protein E3O68_05370 [Cryobacterium sp. TMB3-1-2]
MALWSRRPADAPSADGAAAVFGVGMQVVVRLDRSRYPDSMVEDPIGVITAPGELVGSALYAPVVGKEAVWVVHFEEPFYGLDGTGPHESARVSQGSLEAAPES